MSELTQAQLKFHISYDQETGVFTRLAGRNAGKNAGAIRKDGYFVVKINSKPYLAHRLAWLYVYGEMPIKDTDHINSIKADNRISNLRDCSRTENMWNVGIVRTNTSGFRGASWSKVAGKWVSQIAINGKKTNLGYFATAELAGEAYQIKAKELHRQFYCEV